MATVKRNHRGETLIKLDATERRCIKNAIGLLAFLRDNTTEPDKTKFNALTNGLYMLAAYWAEPVKKDS